MNKEELKFDTFFKSYGGIFIQDDAFIADVKKLIHMGVAFLTPRYPAMPNINGNIIFNNSLNASAGKDLNDFYLGFNVGAFFLIHDMFQKMMATKTIKSNIGDISLETDEKKSLNALREKNNVIAFDISNPANFVLPKDRERSEIASLYTSLAMDFLVFHEFGHILRGHLGYLSVVKKMPFLNEIKLKEEKRQIEPLMNRTLEMDADSFAVNNSYIKGMMFVANPNQLPHPLNSLYKDGLTFLTNWVFVIYALFRLFDFNIFSGVNLKELWYPPASIRVSMIINNVLAILIHSKVENTKFIVGKLLEAAKDAEHAYSEITFNNNDYSIFSNNHLAATAYVEEIMYNWNNVYPLVKPFAFGPLPPIVQK